MESTVVSLILTTHCNLKCKYCINNSGEDLIIDNEKAKEWESSEDIIKCLENIAKVRNIEIVKFFGGEPLLRADLIEEIIKNKYRFSNDGNVKFAFTTNAYKRISSRLLELMKKNRVILNISLDGPEMLNNAARIARDGGNCYKNVIDNLRLLFDHEYPFAIVSVLDERVVDFKSSISEISKFISKYTPIYKIEPAYMIKEIDEFGYKQNEILKQQKEFINNIFEGIFSLDESNYIYENNILRTMHAIVYNKTKDYVCSAAGFIAVFPSNEAYSCYNLMEKKYRISEDISLIEPQKLDRILEEKKELLKISNFPKEYKEIEFFGDYCPKENNFKSFAYLYRKKMIENIYENLKNIKPGSMEHLSLLSYINKGFSYDFFKSFLKDNEFEYV